MWARLISPGGRGAAADQAGVADGVVRGAERPHGHQGLARLQQAHDTVDARGLQALGGSQWRQNRRQPLGQQGLAGSGRANHQDIMDVFLSRTKNPSSTRFLRRPIDRTAQRNGRGFQAGKLDRCRRDSLRVETSLPVQQGAGAYRELKKLTFGANVRLRTYSLLERVNGENSPAGVTVLGQGPAPVSGGSTCIYTQAG